MSEPTPLMSAKSKKHKSPVLKLGLKKFGLGKLWVEKIGAQNILINFYRYNVRVDRGGFMYYVTYLKLRN